MNTPASVEPVVRPDRLQQYVSSIYSATGMSEDDAAHLSSILVEADLRGVHTHGVAFTPTYVERLLDPLGINPQGKPNVTRAEGSTLLVDADNAMGHLAARFAMLKAIERANETNIAAASVGHSNHCGAMAYYPMLALERDMIGIATTNCLPSMAAWGGIDQILGNYPVAAAIPAFDERSIVLDLSFQNTFPLKVELWRDRGWPLPEDWSFDPQGKPTTDYDAALAGWGQPSGKYKGVALALLFGILSALLSDAAWGHDLGQQLPVPRPNPGRDGHFFLALRIGAFVDVERFKRRVDGIIREIHGSRPAEGVDRILLPGERAAETAAQRRRDGIPLPQATLSNLAATATGLGVAVPELS